MLRRNERNLDNIPVGALGIVALDGIQEMGDKVNDYIVKWRRRKDMPTRTTWHSAAMSGTTT